MVKMGHWKEAMKGDRKVKVLRLKYNMYYMSVGFVQSKHIHRI